MAINIRLHHGMSREYVWPDSRQGLLNPTGTYALLEATWCTARCCAMRCASQGPVRNTGDTTTRSTDSASVSAASVPVGGATLPMDAAPTTAACAETNKRRSNLTYRMFFAWQGVTTVRAATNKLAAEKIKATASKRKASRRPRHSPPRCDIRSDSFNGVHIEAVCGSEEAA